MRQQPVPLSDGAVAVPVPPPVEMPTPAQQRAEQRQARRQALHQQVWALHHQGWTAPAIAQQVGLGLRTVQRDLRSHHLCRAHTSQRPRRQGPQPV